jgi:RNA polymerase sigma-70 factor (ECF subfamily)
MPSGDAFEGPKPAEAERLLAAVAPRLAPLARAFARSPEEAEDLQQAMSLSIIRAHGQHRGEGAPEAWAGRVALNTCRVHVRRRRLERSVVESLAAHDLPVPALDQPEPGGELGARLEEALDRLEPRQAEAIRLRALAGLSCAEIAVALDMTEGAVQQALCRARRHLADILTPCLEKHP